MKEEEKNQSLAGIQTYHLKIKSSTAVLLQLVQIYTSVSLPPFYQTQYLLKILAKRVNNSSL